MDRAAWEAPTARRLRPGSRGDELPVAGQKAGLRFFLENLTLLWQVDGLQRSSELRRAASSFDHLGERGSWGETHDGYRAAEDLLRLFFDTIEARIK